jgi:PTH1 family peptidyl-tRNA hydrolase
MSNEYRLIIGLGNPGAEYKNTRHNIGFIYLDYIIKEYNAIGFLHNRKYNAEITILQKNDMNIIFAKPMTYMNLSGDAVQKIKNFYKIPNHNIIVIHDDIDLKFGEIKYVNQISSAAGHNGIKSINNYIGNDYRKIRIGIGRPSIDIVNSNNKEYNHNMISKYVLSNFTKEELDSIEDILLKVKID